MAAHAVDDLFEAVELEARHDAINASIENGAGCETRSPAIPPQLPPVVNAYEQVTKLASYILRRKDLKNLKIRIFAGNDKPCPCDYTKLHFITCS